MRLPLRTRILLITVVPIVTLVFTTLAVVNHTITRQVRQSIHDDLTRASKVAENVLQARAGTLALAGDVIARDPKFFSVLTIPGSGLDPQLRSTVAGVARDFNLLVHSDLFEVLDARGRLLASVGRESSDEEGRRPLVARALGGSAAAGVLTRDGEHYQVQVVPVTVAGRTVGALLLGLRIDDRLAADLRELTRSHVTFVSDGVSTGSTLDRREDRDALLEVVQRQGGGLDARLAQGTVFEVHTRGHVDVTLAHGIPGADPGQRQLYVMQRSLDAETAFLRGMQGGLIGLGVLALVFAVGAGILIAQRIISPVHRLVRAAEEMERGNYEFPLEIGGHDEIADLSRRFDDMRGKQRQVVSSLEEMARVKSEFIAVASHEIRTPISIIIGFQELMAQGELGPITAEQKDALNAIQHGVQTLTRIADDATRMSQIESERLVLSCAPEAVTVMLEEAVQAALRDAPRRHVPVTIESAGAPEIAVVDGPRLTQAIANLVRNGVRFTPDGGRVTVRAAGDEHTLEIAVSDTGVGIPHEKQRHVFESAFMVRESHHHHSSSTLEFNSAGLGLGLSIAGGIVRAHGGTILLESEVARGSTFTIMIPLQGAALEKAA
jgi:signal transduction histidine kinase